MLCVMPSPETANAMLARCAHSQQRLLNPNPGYQYPYHQDDAFAVVQSLISYFMRAFLLLLLERMINFLI